MAASTAASANLPSKKLAYVNLPLKATCQFKTAAHVMVDSSGYLIPASDTSGASYVGRFFDPNIDTTGQADGYYTGKVTPRQVDRYQIFNATSPLASWVNKIASFVDDKTVALAATNTNDIAAGRILEIYTTQVLVDTGDIANAPVAA